MNPYQITGPESLIHAAFKEAFEALGKDAQLPNTGRGPFKEMYFSKDGRYWLSVDTGPANFIHVLTLPADWDKLMDLLADLKKPKLPEYLQSVKGRVYKVIGPTENPNTLYAYNAYGVQKTLLRSDKHFSPITEQEFIEGGLKELAEAGFVKGAQVKYGSGGGVYTVNSVKYHTHGGRSGAVLEEIKDTGFCFQVVDGAFALPISQCTLVPAQLTTSNGIPYEIDGPHVFFDRKGADRYRLPLSLLYLLAQSGVTGLDTPAGRLTQADLKLLTK
ncbi:MAG: hypothetical protein NVS3B25_34440 [Hymenobacter sp.]